MEIIESARRRRDARRMAEFHIRIFLRGFSDKGLMTERIGKNQIATLIYKVESRLFAFRKFGNPRFHDKLIGIKSHFFNRSPCRVNKVLIIGRGFIMQTNKPNLNLSSPSPQEAKEAATPKPITKERATVRNLFFMILSPYVRDFFTGLNFNAFVFLYFVFCIDAFSFCQSQTAPVLSNRYYRNAAF